MEERSSSWRKDWTLTTSAFHRLLNWLDESETTSGQSYLELRRRLVAYFDIPTSLVDFMEFYLFNYFKPAVYQQTEQTRQGRALFERVGCGQCHIPDLQIERDRRVADVETSCDPDRGIFNNLFATPVPLF